MVEMPEPPRRPRLQVLEVLAPPILLPVLRREMVSSPRAAAHIRAQTCAKPRGWFTPLSVIAFDKLAPLFLKWLLYKNTINRRLNRPRYQPLPTSGGFSLV